MPEQRDGDRGRPRDQQRDRDDRDRRPAVAEEPSSVSSEPKTTKTPSLTISTMSSARSSNVVPQVVAADAERDRAHEHGDQAVAVAAAARRSRRRWRTPRRARRATAGARDLGVLGISDAASRPIAIPNAKPSVDVLKHELPPHEVLLAGRDRQEGEHGGQREAVVQAGFEVERVAHHARNARVGDHAATRAPGRSARAARRAGSSRPSRGRSARAWPAR